MFNCDKKLRKFHNESVSLTNNQRQEMRNRRDANRRRLLKSGFGIFIEEHQSQGSYAMHTMVQDKNNDYDIDDGVIFSKESLKGNNGLYKSALGARKMIRNAVDDGTFKQPPEVRNHCVRVYYDRGGYVDMPIYRRLGNGTWELASSDWKESDPCAITKWFNIEVIRKSPDTDNGRQLRRIVKLTKFYKNSRNSWKIQMVSGFIISALVIECYVSDDRDDIAFYKTIQAIYNRLERNLEVSHPTLDEKLTDGDDAKIKFLRDRLGEAIKHLEVLFQNDCDEKSALNAWYKIFQHQYWKYLEDNSEASLGIVGLATTFGALGANLTKRESEIDSFPHISATKATKPYLQTKPLIPELKMIVDKEDRKMLKEEFPNLNIIFTGDVAGRIKFHSKYIQNSHHEWMIESCTCDNDKSEKCFKGDYQIQISFKNGRPVVFETGNKIINIANKQNKHINDLHINSDKSCCLDYHIGENLTLYEFIKNKVYPYFAWQSYYEKFNQIPPCGEYSHSKKVIDEFQKDIRRLGRNDICTCGTGKKYKDCCLRN